MPCSPYPRARLEFYEALQRKVHADALEEAARGGHLACVERLLSCPLREKALHQALLIAAPVHAPVVARLLPLVDTAAAHALEAPPISRL